MKTITRVLLSVDSCGPLSSEHKGDSGWTSTPMMMLLTRKTKIISSAGTSGERVLQKLILQSMYSSGSGTGFISEMGNVNGTPLFSASNTPGYANGDSLDGGLTIYKAGALNGTEEKGQIV